MPLVHLTCAYLLTYTYLLKGGGGTDNVYLYVFAPYRPPLIGTNLFVPSWLTDTNEKRVSTSCPKGFLLTFLTRRETDVALQGAHCGKDGRARHESLTGHRHTQRRQLLGY